MADTPDLSLEGGDRLDRLERALHRQRTLNAVLCLLVASSVLIGAASSEKEVTARRFVVQDDQGKTRATLSMGRAGGPSLTFYDQTGRIRADLSVILDHPQLALYRKDGNVAAQVAIGADDNPGVWLLDQAKKERLTLELRDQEGSPVLKLLGGDGDPRLVAAVVRSQPMLVMLNAQGSSVWQAP